MSRLVAGAGRQTPKTGDHTEMDGAPKRATVILVFGSKRRWSSLCTLKTVSRLSLLNSSSFPVVGAPAILVGSLPLSADQH